MIMLASLSDDQAIGQFDTGLTTRVFLATSPRRNVGDGRQLAIGIAVALIVINNISRAHKLGRNWE